MSAPNSVNFEPSAAQQPQPPVAPVQKQRINIFTMMLVVSFFAITIGCFLLWRELSLYGDFPWWNTAG